MNPLVPCLLLLLLCSAAEGEERLNVIHKAMQCTVSVYPADDSAEAGGGSGVVISPDGYAVTNFHVVQPCGISMKCAMADGNLYDAVVVGIDPVGDIALIKMALPKTETTASAALPFAELTDSDTVQVGDTAIVIGNPFLLATDFQGCVSQGIISGVHRYQPPSGTFLEYTDCLQTDAAVNPGNSGGPLFNEQGGIIGIVGRCSFEKRGRVNVGIGFAVSSNQVRYFLGVLKSGQIVDHSTMNAAVSTDKSGRVLFSDVLGTADAYRSGLRYDDELLRFAGRTIDSANTFKNVLGIFPKGWRLPVTVRGSDGKRFETFVRLAGLHSEAELQQWTAESGFWKMKDDKKLPKNKERKKTSAAPALPPSDYESRTGYANFYYNRIERQRVLKAFRNWTLNNGYWTTADKDAAANNASWTISTSKTAFVVSDGGIQYTLPLGKGFWNVNLMLETKEFVTDPLSHYQAPRGSGGLFTALYLMRRLYLSDDAADADIFYAGTAPLAGNLDVLCDVITAAWRGNEVRFYFAPATGKPVLVEMFGSAIEHPCEVYFRGNGIEVRCGKNTFLREEGETKSKEDDDDNALVSKPSLQQLDKTSPHFVLHAALTKVVRIYGASAGGIHGYQSGVLVSENGRVLTALTSALQSSPLRVVLHDGRQYEAEMTQANLVKETALLQIKTEDANERFAYFVLPDKEAEEVIPPALPGTAVYALSNPFNIAEGSEAVSVQKGQIAARTLLSARRGVFETPYRGGIYVVDFTVNNPGACGGAVIAADTGALLGIIGKELRNKENNAWLNYAVPVTSLASNNSSGGTVRTERREWQRELIPEDTSRTLQAWGLLLITPVGERTPPFVDAVLPDSAAAKAGVQPDDLIVMFNGVLTPSLAVIGELINQADKTKPVVLSVERSHTLLELTIKN